jgi:hypothetical protein
MRCAFPPYALRLDDDAIGVNGFRCAQPILRAELTAGPLARKFTESSQGGLRDAPEPTRDQLPRSKAFCDAANTLCRAPESVILPGHQLESAKSSKEMTMAVSKPNKRKKPVMKEGVEKPALTEEELDKVSGGQTAFGAGAMALPGGGGTGSTA